MSHPIDSPPCDAALEPGHAPLSEMLPSVRLRIWENRLTALNKRLDKEESEMVLKERDLLRVNVFVGGPGPARANLGTGDPLRAEDACGGTPASDPADHGSSDAWM